MLSNSPHPRFRVYASTRFYFDFFAGLLTNTSPDAVPSLEDRVKGLFGVSHARCVPQARVGIYHVIKHLVRPGAEVIMSPFTIADVVNMVICAGARPVFADTERKSCNIDPGSVRELINDKTGAVIVTHMHGLMAPVEELSELCREANIPLVEDAAQALGACRNGRYAGTIGDAGVFSFGQYKTVHSFYGGMVVTGDAGIYDEVHTRMEANPPVLKSKLAKRAVSCLIKSVATSYPLFPLITFPIFRYGKLHDVAAINRISSTELDLRLKEAFPEAYNESMTPLQAKTVFPGLAGMEADTAIRIKHAQAYHEWLSGVEGITLPPLHVDGSHIYTCFAVQVEDREHVIRELMRDNRDIAIQHIKNCADLDSFAAFYRECPNARANGKQTIMLPTYPSYGLSEVQLTVEALRRILKQN